MRFLSLLFLVPFISFAQNEEQGGYAEIDPVFPGGEQAMAEFISANIVYPDSARINCEEGVVYVQFIVEKDGSLSEVTVVRGASPSLDEEAVRVVKMMPNWSPGEQKGEPVRVRFTLPISFRIDCNEDIPPPPEEDKKSGKKKSKK